MKVLSVVLCVLGAVYCDVIDLNSEIDDMLGVIRHVLEASNETEVVLPDVTLAYSKKVMFMTFRLEVNGTGGSVQNLTTVRRKNNITVVSSGDSLSVRLEFGFKDLRIAYDYVAKFLWLHVTGAFRVNIRDNAVAIELGINLTEYRCSGVIDVKSISFTSFDGIETGMTGFGLMNSLMNAFVSNSLLDVTTSFKESVESIFTRKLQDNLSTFNICGSEKNNILKFLSSNFANLSAPNFINMVFNQNVEDDRILDTL